MGRLYLPSSEDPPLEESEETAVPTAVNPEPELRTGRIYVGVTANVEPVTEPADDEVIPVREPGPDATPGLEVPAGSLEERVAWVADGGDTDAKRERADAVYTHEVEAADLDEAGLAELGASLTEAVYGLREPDGNASREEWVAFAKAKGAPEDDTKPKDEGGLGRDALREKYGSKS